MPFDETNGNGGGGSGPCEECEGKGYGLALIVTKDTHLVVAQPCKSCQAGRELKERAKAFADLTRREFSNTDIDDSDGNFRHVSDIVNSMYRSASGREDGGDNHE